MRRFLLLSFMTWLASIFPAERVRADEESRAPSSEPALDGFRWREGLRFGVGGECAGGGVAFGLRAFARMNYAASRLIELRWDAVVGGSFNSASGKNV